MSTLGKLDLPPEIGILLFTVALVCALAPYFPGLDFGVFKVPEFGTAKTNFLKRYGWLVPLLAIALFLPLWPQDEFKVRVKFQGQGIPLDCQQLSTATATLRIGAEAYHASINAHCVAEFLGISPKEKNREAQVEITGAPAFLLVEEGVLHVPNGSPLIVELEEAATVPRLGISILPYQVQDPSMRTQFQEFTDALVNETFNISKEFAGNGARFTYLNGLKVLSGGPPMGSAAELGGYWNESHALQLVRATNVEPDARPTTIDCLVYLGALAPNPQLTGLNLKMKVTPEAYSRNQDSYSLIVLYSLAQDAKKLRMPDYVVAAYLSEAFAIGQQLRDPDQDLRAIESVVDVSLRQFRAAGAAP